MSETRWQATELKFLVSPDCASLLKVWGQRYLEMDPHASPETGDGYFITTLYCDTPGFDVFHRNGSYGHAKYRVRRYGRGDEIFLERKLRNRDMVVKRRSIVAVGELAKLHGGKPSPEWDGYWFHRRVVARGLRPVCQVAYHRTARVGTSHAGPIRLTIDQNLHARTAEGVIFDHTEQGANLLDNRLIVEMKFREGLPELFRRAIEEFGLRPGTISKYKLAAKRLGLAEDEVVAPSARYEKVKIA